MLLMNVTNKSSNSGILRAGGIQLSIAKELIHQWNSKEQQKICNLKIWDLLFGVFLINFVCHATL